MVKSNVWGKKIFKNMILKYKIFTTSYVQAQPHSRWKLKLQQQLHQAVELPLHSYPQTDHQRAPHTLPATMPAITPVARPTRPATRTCQRICILRRSCRRRVHSRSSRSLGFRLERNSDGLRHLHMHIPRSSSLLHV